MKSLATLRVAFAGGGTGGHIVPGLHLLERSREGGGDVPVLEDLLWFTSGRPVEDRVLEAVPGDAPWRREVLDLEPQGGGAPSRSRLVLKTPAGVVQARRALREHRTQVLLGLGGFTTLPAVLAARSLGIPVALLEINAAPGKATRHLQRFAERVFHAWEGTLPPGGPGARHLRVGAPVAPAVTRVGAGAGSPETAREQLGMDPSRPLLLVLGGSQGAGSLNRFVAAHCESWVKAGLQILHQCGPGKRSELPADAPGFQVREFLSPIAPALEGATLVLCRGGASTLAEVAAARRPALVVPYPHHADRHQERNARELGGGIRLMDESALEGQGAQSLLGLALDSGAGERARMAAELARRNPGDAAARILEELHAMTHKPR